MRSKNASIDKIEKNVSINQFQYMFFLSDSLKNFATSILIKESFDSKFHPFCSLLINS